MPHVGVLYDFRSSRLHTWGVVRNAQDLRCGLLFSIAALSVAASRRNNFLRGGLAVRLADELRLKFVALNAELHYQRTEGGVLAAARRAEGGARWADVRDLQPEPAGPTSPLLFCLSSSNALPHARA